MTIERVCAVTDELSSAFARLLPQLSTARLPTPDELAALVAQPDTHLLVARHAGAIAGVSTLTLYRIPTGLQARIDDVVVDAAARGQGLGEALTRASIDIARAAGARNLSLTSRPDREAANRLYQRLGFIVLATNAYRLPLG